MPLVRRARRVRHRRQRGRGLMDWLGKANNFLKSSKLVSTVGNALGSAGVPFASQIGNIAGSLGYGRRVRKGRGLTLAGGMRRRCR